MTSLGFVLYIKALFCGVVSAVQVAYLGRMEFNMGSDDLMRVQRSRYVGHSMPSGSWEAEPAGLSFRVPNSAASILPRPTPSPTRPRSMRVSGVM